MFIASMVFFGVAAVIHVLFFVIEAVLFQKPNGYKYFKMEEKDHKAAKLWAFNQGFYNLFFAIGTFAGLATEQSILLIFCSVSMIGAGLVLWFSAPQLRRGSLIQMLPPLLALILFFLPRG